MLDSSGVRKQWVNYIYRCNAGTFLCIIKYIVLHGLVLTTLEGVGQEVLASVSYIQTMVSCLLQ